VARHDPLLPNALIVARREYRDRTRSPLFVASTLVLMILAIGVAMTPITMSYLDRGTQTGVAVVAADAELSQRAVAVLESVLNAQPPNADPVEWRPPFRIEAASLEAAEERLAAGRIDGMLVVERLDGGW
jgi:ABC-type Na+ efflux pump permease subunit